MSPGGSIGQSTSVSLNLVFPYAEADDAFARAWRHVRDVSGIPLNPGHLRRISPTLRGKVQSRKMDFQG